MKGIFKVAGRLLVLFTFSAAGVGVAAPINPPAVVICESYGYTSDVTKFHSIKTDKQVTEFVVSSDFVTANGVFYSQVRPSWVGLDGLAATYHDRKSNKLLYLYVTDRGEREVGVSAIEPDSDTIFRDKAVYKDCRFKEGVSSDSTNQVLRTSKRGVQSSLPVFVL